MNPKDYGNIISTSLMDNFTRYIITTNNNNRIFQIDISLDSLVNNVTILGASNLKWTDTKLDKSNYFKRDIGKSTIYFY